MRIQRDLTLNHLRCQGPLNLNHSTIGGTLHLAHAQLGDSLYLRGIQLAIPTPRPQIEIATQEAAPAPSLDTGKDSASIANSATESTAESTTKSTTALTTELATELAANPESTANPAVNPATKPSPGSDFTDNPEPTANPAADPGISTAINAPNLQINHSLYLQDNFCIHGQVHLSGAILGQALEIGGGQWLAPNDIALQASGLRVRHLLLGPSLNPDAKSQGRTVPQPLESHQDPHVPLASPSAQSQTQRETSPEAPLREAPLRMIGQVIFAGATIGDRLESQNCHLSPALSTADLSLPPSAPAIPFSPTPSTAGLASPSHQPFYQPQFLLNCQNLNVHGDILLHNQFQADGLVKLTGSRIQGHLICNASRFQNPGKVALDGERLQVAGDVRLRNGFAVAGWVRLVQAQIRGSLILYDIETPQSFKLDLQGAEVGWLQDEAQSWPLPGYLRLEGCRYHRFSESVPQDAIHRLDWLSRMPNFCPQPYQHLAHVLRTQGQDQASEHIRLAQLLRGRSIAVRGLPRSVVSLWSLILGYRLGFKSLLLASTSLVLLGTGCFSRGYRQGLFSNGDMGQVPTFSRSINQNPSQPPGFSPLFPQTQGDTQILTPLPHPTATPPPLPNPQPDAFQAWAYSLDSFFPLINLQQANTWQPNPDRGQTIGLFALKMKSGGLLQYYFWLHSLGGWGLTFLWLRSLILSAYATQNRPN